MPTMRSPVRRVAASELITEHLPELQRVGSTPSPRWLESPATSWSAPRLLCLDQGMDRGEHRPSRRGRRLDRGRRACGADEPVLSRSGEPARDPPLHDGDVRGAQWKPDAARYTTVQTAWRRFGCPSWHRRFLERRVRRGDVELETRLTRRGRPAITWRSSMPAVRWRRCMPSAASRRPATLGEAGIGLAQESRLWSMGDDSRACGHGGGSSGAG